MRTHFSFVKDCFFTCVYQRSWTPIPAEREHSSDMYMQLG